MHRRVLPILIAVALAVSGCAVVAKQAAQIVLLAVADRGIDAFLDNVGADIHIASSASRGGAIDGDAPGLYGGTRSAARCDPAKLIKFLDRDPVKAKAWAGAHKIKVSRIPAFIGRLTPVILRRDTLVTNHGFKAGKGNAVSAVLQAGIAVLVDDRGVPMVKCNCGNPLTEATVKLDHEVEITVPKGSRNWGFKRERAVRVRKPARKVTSLELVQPGTGTAFSRPVGTGGTDDGAPEQAPPEPVAEPDPMIPAASPTPSGPTPTGSGTAVPTPTATPPGPVDPSGSPASTDAGAAAASPGTG